MRDVDIINKAIEDAQAKVANYLEAGPRHTQVTLERIMGILERDDLIAAQERMSRGFGNLRVVK
jgi:phage gp36-like protein